MSAIEGHMGTILNLLFLIIMIALGLFEMVIQKETPKLHSQPHREILNETPDAVTMPLIVKEQPYSYRLLLKSIIALQIITLVLSVLIYFKS